MSGNSSYVVQGVAVIIAGLIQFFSSNFVSSRLEGR